MIRPRGLSAVALLTLVAGAGAAGLWAQERRSPFELPKSAPAAAAPAENSPIEFRGLFVKDGRQHFNFFDRAKSKSTWVVMNEAGASYQVKGFDANDDSVQVEFEGRSMRLALEKPKIANAPLVVPAPPAPTVAGATAPVAPPPVVLNPTPADEAKRLDAIAAEVRRRRAMRQQQSGAPGAPINQ